MKHLVTGGNGFLGHALISHLGKHFPGDAVFSLGKSPFKNSPCPHWVCDLTQKEAVESFIQKEKPDWVYHLAGSPRVTDRTQFPDYFAKNFLSTALLTDSLTRLDKPITFFFASSVHVYGNQLGSITEESPCRPLTDYGFTKYLAEELLRSQVKQAPQFSAVVGRLYSCVGPGQGPGFVAADLCRKISHLSPSPAARLSVGPLSGSRSFLDVRDAVTLFPALLSAERRSRFEIVNITPPHTLKISRMLELVLKIAKKNPQIESSPHEAENKFAGLAASNKKLKALVPNLYFRPIEETLRDMYEWTNRHKEKE